MPTYGFAKASPSLALIKYWGKSSKENNTPATPSLAVTLAGLESTTSARFADRDQVVLDGKVQDPAQHAAFFDLLRAELKTSQHFAVESANNFPTAAGLASSSSGYAALTGAVAALCQEGLTPNQLSTLARRGSGSATRAIYGGFTLFDAGAEAAVPVHDEAFWPDFRVLIVTVRDEAKAVSSRVAMEQTRLTSPYYQDWITSSAALLPRAQAALAARDLDSLGPLVRMSYLRMFSTMFSAEPPIIYWYPESLGLIRTCEELRASGLGAWETMDAGPQVKIFCLAKDLPAIKTAVETRYPQFKTLTSQPGPGLQTWTGDRL